MAVRQIVHFPDEVLTHPTEEVTEYSEPLQVLIADMAETMYATRGLGLAANQLGVPKRLFVIDLGEREDGPARLLAFVNPRLVEQQGKQCRDEGCLSFPGGFSVDVPRAEKVRVRASNEHGEEFEVEAEGLFATALQHEMDHLDGLTILDRLGKLSRKLALKRYKKVLAEYLAGGDPEDEDQEEEQ